MFKEVFARIIIRKKVVTKSSVPDGKNEPSDELLESHRHCRGQLSLKNWLILMYLRRLGRFRQQVNSAPLPHYLRLDRMLKSQGETHILNQFWFAKHRLGCAVFTPGRLDVPLAEALKPVPAPLAQLDGRGLVRAQRLLECWNERAFKKLMLL